MTSRPRLLVLASTFPATANDPTPAFIRDLALQEATSYDTTVLVPAVPGGAGRERLESLSVLRFRFFPRRWEDLADGAILENLRARPSRMLQVPPFLLAEILAVRRAVRATRPDLLHVHWIIPQGVAALLGARRVPMLVTTLGGDLYGLRDPLSRWLIRAVVSRATAITTMNEDMRQRLIELGADPDRTHVLPMGANVVAVRAIAGECTQVEGRVLFVGRLVEKKGLAVLIDALRMMPHEGLEVHVVGDGPLRAELTDRAAGLPIKFLGALRERNLAAQYGEAEIVVFPSVRAKSGDQDGLPVAMLEAMAAGRAVIASDLPGLGDAIENGVSGVLVPAGDPGALAAQLTGLLHSPSERQHLEAGALARSENYSLATIAARYLKLLDDIRPG
jgi:colanic acid/amylovoran biosynthesis glycosyltransferase